MGKNQKLQIDIIQRKHRVINNRMSAISDWQRFVNQSHTNILVESQIVYQFRA